MSVTLNAERSASSASSETYVAPFTFRYVNTEVSGEVIHEGGDYRIADPVLSRFLVAYREWGHSTTHLTEWIFPHPTTWEFEWQGGKITVKNGFPHISPGSNGFYTPHFLFRDLWSSRRRNVFFGARFSDMLFAEWLTDFYPHLYVDELIIGHPLSVFHEASEGHKRFLDHLPGTEGMRVQEFRSAVSAHTRIFYSDSLLPEDFQWYFDHCKFLDPGITTFLTFRSVHDRSKS